MFWSCKQNNYIKHENKVLADAFKKAELPHEMQQVHPGETGLSSRY